MPDTVVSKAYRLYRNRGPLAVVQRALERVRLRIRSRYRAGKPVVALANAWRPIAFESCLLPEVSIVIPAHNHALVTFSCLQSISETKTDVSYEVIVVDDGSSDDTPSMLSTMRNIHVVRNESNRGFIEASNAGARAARGRYVLFLNNDTIVLPNWLDELRKTFELFPDAGLVGGKLIYPDGRLQEAGAIVWKNGDALNYGRYDQAEKPEYCYARDVDYCSGACLLIKKELFDQLGGFDTAFAPAYCEDVDLAFKVRQAGKRVLYQPLAQVVHFEGTSSGTNVLQGVKQHQIVNQAKLAKRWEASLVHHANPGENVQRERDRGIAKRVLIIDGWTPTPDQDSGSIRIMDFIRIFQELNYHVTFCADHMEFTERYTADLQRRGVRCLYSPYMDSIHTHLKREGEKYDVILSCRPDVTEKYLPSIRMYASRATILYETVDLHYIREQRQAELDRSEALARQASARKHQELRIIESVDCAIVVSERERECVLKELPHAKVAVVTNAHECLAVTGSFRERRDLCFLGGFQHAPNVDAAVYLVREVLPLVKQHIPDVKVYLIGSRVTKAVQALASEDVIVTGYVRDLGAYLPRCKVSVNPLRFGAGIKGKVLSSMAYGLPCVGTTVCFDGMNLRDGEDVLIADHAGPLCGAIVALYNNEALWSKLARNGHDIVESRHSIGVAKRQVETILAKVQEWQEYPTHTEVA